MDGRLSAIKHLFPVETLSPEIVACFVLIDMLVSNKTFISCWTFVTWDFTKPTGVSLWNQCRSISGFYIILDRLAYKDK
jgi:hypothetical protein